MATISHWLSFIPWHNALHLAMVLGVFLFTLVGIAIVPLGLPGTWLIVVAGAVYSLLFPFDGGATSGMSVMVKLIGVAFFGEVMEFAVGTLGSKPLKVSNGAIFSAFIGGIVGAIVGVPVVLVGSLIGLFLGAFLGAFFYELVTLKNLKRAFLNACAVLATRIVATALKTTLALGMGIYLFFKLF